MKSLTILALLAATLTTSAQTTTTAASSTATTAGDPNCLAANVVDACLESQGAIQQACNVADYGCQCSAYNNIMTCFNNCPNDPRAPAQQGQRDNYCALNSQYPSSTASAYSAPQTTGATATADSKGAGATATGSGTSSTGKANVAGVGKTIVAGWGVIVAGVMGALL